MPKLCPTCFSEIGIWTDDPILTPKGLSGIDYIGNTEDNVKHIRELQDRCIVEEEANLVSPKTIFSSIGKEGTREFTLQHINEIRKSIEKILFAKAKGGSDVTPLLELYFNYDAEGNYVGTGKTNWTDIELNNRTKIKAIHIEDLRHPIPEIVEIEYPGTGFLRRYTTLDLVNVYTNFYSWNGDSASLSQGDTVRFTSNFLVKNTEVWYENIFTYKVGFPNFVVEGWDLTGSASNILATIELDADIELIRVGGSITGTDGTNLWHHISGEEHLDHEGNPINVDVWELGDVPELHFEYYNFETGEWETLEPVLVDKENAPYTGWTSFYIWKILKTPSTVDFSLFPGYDIHTQWVGDPPIINPAPSGYECTKIGNGSPEEYWNAYNAEYGTDRSEYYIGYIPVTVRFSPTHIRTYCNWGYYETIGGAPIRAEYKKGDKTVIYTCNIL